MNCFGFNMYSAYTKKRFSKGVKSGEIIGTGWLPPLPDMKDYDNEHPTILSMSKKLGVNPKGSKPGAEIGRASCRERV